VGEGKGVAYPSQSEKGVVGCSSIVRREPKKKGLPSEMRIVELWDRGRVTESPGLPIWARTGVHQTGKTLQKAERFE